MNDEKKKSKPQGNGEESTQFVIFASKSRVCAGNAFLVMRTLAGEASTLARGMARRPFAASVHGLPGVEGWS